MLAADSHLHLWAQNNQIQIDWCYYRNYHQHIHHLLRDCTIPHVITLRDRLRSNARAVFRRNIGLVARDPLQLEETNDYYTVYNVPIYEMPTADELNDPNFYIYPDGRLPREDRSRLQRSLCHFYKLLRRRRQGQNTFLWRVWPVNGEIPTYASNHILLVMVYISLSLFSFPLT